MNKTFPKPTPNPRLAGLPAYLKDPKIYDKIQRALLETLSCAKTHSEPSRMFNCATCQTNASERRFLMKKFGFKSVEQYMEWRKVMETILRPPKKAPLDKYNKDKFGNYKEPPKNEPETN
jgi:hypothetical protein